MGEEHYGRMRRLEGHPSQGKLKQGKCLGAKFARKWKAEKESTPA